MKFWTKAGIARLDEEIRTVRARALRAAGDRADEVRSSSSSEGGQIERASHDAGLAVVQKQLAEKIGLRNSLRVASVPSNMERVCVGHQVTVEYLDPSTRKKAGDVETFILGGPGESDVDSNTISQSGPFGRTLYDRAVNEEVDVETDFGTFGVRIVAISMPSLGAPVAQAA